MKAERVFPIVALAALLLSLTALLATGAKAQGDPTKTWPFTDPDSYIYDNATIEVRDGYAQLKMLNIPPWWDEGYAYRQQLVVSNNGTSTLPAGYSVKLSFSHYNLVQAGKSLVSGGDVRIVYWNGSSYVELDRVNETSWNSSGQDAELWFKTAASIAGLGSDSNYYVYYGNPSAGTPPANRSDIYLWYDDFSTNTLSDYDMAKWVTLHGNPSQYVVPTYDAANQRVSFDTGDNYALDMYPIGLTVDDFLMEVDFWAEASYPTDATIALVGRLENPGTSSTHYYLDFSHGNYDSPGITVDSWANGQRSNTVYSEASDYYWSCN